MFYLGNAIASGMLPWAYYNIPGQLPWNWFVKWLASFVNKEF